MPASRQISAANYREFPRGWQWSAKRADANQAMPIEPSASRYGQDAHGQRECWLERDWGRLHAAGTMLAEAADAGWRLHIAARDRETASFYAAGHESRARARRRLGASTFEKQDVAGHAGRGRRLLPALCNGPVVQ